MITVRAHVRKSKRRFRNESVISSVREEETGIENLQKLLENVSLKNVPLEERRREANKPLYLFRYE